MQERLWTGNYILNLINNLLLFMVFYAFMVYTTKFAMSAFGASVSQAGLAAGMFIISAVLARLFAGRYMDILGRKRLMMVSMIVYAACTFCYYIVGSMNFLILLRFIHGLSYGIISTVMATAIISVVPAARRGEGIGYFSLSLTMASAVGPFLGITLPQLDPLYLLVLCDGICVIAVVLTYFITVPEIKVGFRQRVEMKSLRLRTFLEPTAIPISIVALLGAVGYSAVMSYIGAYAEAIDLLLGGSLFYVSYSLACLVFRPFTGMVLDRYGNHVVMIPMLICMMLGFVTIAVAHSNIVLLIGAALVGIGYGSIPSAGQAIAVQKVKLNRFSMATATLFMALDIGNGVGPSILGMIVPLYGFRAVYLCSAAVSLLAFIYYCVMALKGRRAKAAAK